jgi:hypothetical protein
VSITLCYGVNVSMYVSARRASATDRLGSRIGGASTGEVGQHGSAWRSSTPPAEQAKNNGPVDRRVASKSVMQRFDLGLCGRARAVWWSTGAYAADHQREDPCLSTGPEHPLHPVGQLPGSSGSTCPETKPWVSRLLTQN